MLAFWSGIIKFTLLASAFRAARSSDDFVIGRFKESELAPRVGLEPTTKRLTAAYSTIELPRNTGIIPAGISKGNLTPEPQIQSANQASRYRLDKLSPPQVSY